MMTEAFEQKLQVLNNKLNSLQKPISLDYKQNRCRQHLEEIKAKISDKEQVLEKSLKLIEERIEKYEGKIQRTKITVKQFSGQKLQRIKQLIEKSIEDFNQSFYKTKQNLKYKQTAWTVKMNQMQKNKELTVKTIETNIRKNIKKINSQIQKIGKSLTQERNLIKKQFDYRKIQVLEYVSKSEKTKIDFQKRIQCKLLQLNMKIDSKIQMMVQKWIKKDHKTKKIFSLLLQDSS